MAYRGTTKHYGKDVAYFTFNGKTYCAWVRIGYSASVQTRDNTNPASDMDQVQVTRADTPTIDAEVMIPWGATGADLVDFIAGTTGDFNIGGPQLFPNLVNYGPYIIERSSIEVSRDNFTSIRLTIRGLGYTVNRVYNSAGAADFDLWDDEF